MLRRPDWDLMSYFMADVLTRQFGPAEALNFLRANGRLPRGSKEFIGLEFRLLEELERWQEILDRIGEDHEPEQFHYARRAVVTAMLLLDRRLELETYCRAWMQQAPEEITPAASIAFLHARANGLAETSHRSRAGPGPAAVHLVQFWNAEQPPTDVQAVMASWSRFNPTWTHTVFNESKVRTLLGDQLGSRATDAFDLCHHPAMMADFFRIALLCAKGGLYVDADEACLRSLDGVLPDLERTELLAPLSGGFPGFVDNSLIGARAGRPHPATDAGADDRRHPRRRSRGPSAENLGGHRPGRRDSRRGELCRRARGGGRRDVLHVPAAVPLVRPDRGRPRLQA